VPGLKLHTSAAAQSPAAPFPITASAEVAAPPAAERYDVSGFRLAVRLQPGVLEGQQGQLLDAVGVEVTSGELPRVLRQRMAAELKQLWAASQPGRWALLPVQTPQKQVVLG